MLKAYLCAFLACVLFTLALLFIGCGGPTGSPDAGMCGNGGTVCDPGQVCWHNNCLDPCQVPDSADMACDNAPHPFARLTTPDFRMPSSSRAPFFLVGGRDAPGVTSAR